MRLATYKQLLKHTQNNYYASNNLLVLVIGHIFKVLKGKGYACSPK